MIRKSHNHLKRAAALATTATLGAAGYFAGIAAIPATASAQTQSSEAVSQNWAGYVDSGKNFSSVSGSWRVPAVTGSGGQGYSVAWVGLGGAGNNSSALEQTGTASDFVNGHAEYFAWYELVPAAQQPLKLAIHPGDQISARVTVNGSDVTVSLADQTTGQSVTKALHMSRPDTSSAEWIVEAPTEVSPSGSTILPLADFGKVNITSATATADGHTGGISDSDWSTTPVQLSSDGSAGPGFVVTGFSSDGQLVVQQQSSAGASPSSLSGNRFSVTWQGGSNGSPTAVQLPSGFAPDGYGYGPGPFYTTLR